MRHVNRPAALAPALIALLVCMACGATPARAQPGNRPPPLLSDLVDVSRDFRDYSNAFYLADSVADFDPATATGRVTWLRHQLVQRLAFDNVRAGLRPFGGVVFPETEYTTNPTLPLSMHKGSL